MKKRLILTFLLFGIILSGIAYVRVKAEELSRNDIREIKGYLRSKIMFSQKLYDCTSFRTEMFGAEALIIGREGSNCHVRIQSTDCYYPLDVAKQYSKISENVLRKMIDEIDSQGTIDQTLMDEEAKQMKRINFQYCQSPSY